MWTSFYSRYWIPYNIAAGFMFCFFLGPKACEILAPQPGVKPEPPCVGRWRLNHLITREALFSLDNNWRVLVFVIQSEDNLGQWWVIEVTATVHVSC